MDLKATLLLPNRYHTHSNHQTKSQGFRAGHSACITKQARPENSMRDEIVPLKPGEVLRCVLLDTSAGCCMLVLRHSDNKTENICTGGDSPVKVDGCFKCKQELEPCSETGNPFLATSDFKHCSTRIDFCACAKSRRARHVPGQPLVCDDR